MIENQRQLTNFSDLQDTHRPRDEDEESALTTLDANEPLGNINLSEYCISSDADTEKMESDIMNEEEKVHPKLSTLLEDKEILEQQNSESENQLHEKAQDQGSKTPSKHKLEDEDEDAESKDGPSDKKIKLETSEVPEQQGSTDSSLQSPIKLSENESESQPQPAAPLTEQKTLLSSSLSEEEEKNMKNVKKDIIDKTEEIEEPDHKDGLDAVVKEVEEDGDEEEDEEADQEEEDRDMEEDEDEDNQGLTEDGKSDNKSDKNKDEKSKKQVMPSPMELENRRLEAMDDIISIEYKFAELRQKLYENKLMKLELELQMCLEGSHPELHGYYEKIASIRDHKLRRAYQRQKYELQCIDKETRATRTMIHQDFYKKVSDLKRELLTSTTKEWYDINKERREMDNVVPEVSYHVPIKIAQKTLSCITGYAGPAQQRLPGEPLSEDLECENIKFRYRHNPVDKLEVIVDRMRLNNALSDLEGLKRYYGGFPGAPTLNGLRDSEIAEDFQELQFLLQQQYAQPQQ